MIKNRLLSIFVYITVVTQSLSAQAKVSELSEQKSAVCSQKTDSDGAKIKQTIYIHIGLPKTGSSYLQHAFAYNASLYAKMGLNYPDFGTNLDLALSGAVTPGNGVRLAFRKPSSLIDRRCWSNQLCDTLPTDFIKWSDPFWSSRFCYSSPIDFLKWLDPLVDHLISSEYLGLVSIAHLREIYSVFSNTFKVVFVCFVRNPSDYICSLYTERLKSAFYTGPPELYIDEMIAMHRQSLRMIIDLASLGDDAWVLLNYDTHKQNLLEAFDAIVFKRKVSQDPPHALVNPSPNCHQVMILRLANTLGLGDKKAARRYVKKGSTKNGIKFELPGNLIEKINERLSSEIEAVNRLLPLNEQIIPSAVHGLDPRPVKTDFQFDDDDIEYLKELMTIRDDNTSLFGRLSAPFRYLIPRLKIQAQFIRTRGKRQDAIEF